MIPDEEVERVREAADIVAIIGEFVPLKGRAGNYRGPCPFHQGVNRNFSVSAQKKFYHCFVCKESGDVFTFLQKRFGMDWPSAVRTVAQKSGIELHEVTRRREGPDPREPLWEANAAAALYFQRLLWEDPLGSAARDYLASREVTRELSERFGLGFAPREIGLLRGYLQSLGIADAVQLEAGLLVTREETDEPRPRFRSRLVFPIHDASGHIAGFGGRLLGPGEPKYLNSAESPVYSKGRLLYHLHQARNAIRREERVFLVEGYFDVVRLVSAGVETVVAPLGTALTPEQAALLVRYTRNVYLLYDSDKAGLTATFRAGDALLAAGATVRVVTLPDGEDPDSFVRAGGRDRLEHEVSRALDVFERKVQLLERGGWFADLTRRRAAIDRLLPTIRATADPVLRDMYVGRASEASGVDRVVLTREVAGRGGARDGASGGEGEGGERRDGPSPGAPPTSRVRRPVDASAGRPGRGSDRRGEERGEGGESGRRPLARRAGTVRAAPGHSAERYLIQAMLRSPAVVERVLERLGADDFRETLHHEIFLALRETGSAEDVEVLAGTLSDGAVALLDLLVADPDGILDLNRTVDDSVARLEARRLEERNEEIDRQMTVASSAEQDALMREKRENTRQLHELRALRESQ